MARVSNETNGIVSLARGIQCWPNLFLFILLDVPLYIAKYMCVYLYTYIHTYIHTHIYICIHICLHRDLYNLPSLPNNTASGTNLHKSGAVRSVDLKLIIVAVTALVLDIVKNIL